MHGIIENLVHELTRLPGIGRKTAQRLAFFILSMPNAEALSLAEGGPEGQGEGALLQSVF